MKNRMIRKISASVRKYIHNSEIDTDDRFLVEFNSEGRLSVHGCRELLEYNENTLTMECENYFINIKGENLYINRFFRNVTSVGGKIDNISFMLR